jgi:predicted Rdx family selenoprotein
MARYLDFDSRLKRCGALVSLCALGTISSFAQQTGINGRVTDPSNASVAAVHVTATGADGTSVSTNTNDTGIYQFPALRAGAYKLRFDASGFSPAERTVTLTVGQVATIDMSLQLARASTSVVVEAVANSVDASTSTVAGAVSPTEVEKVPLNGRNYLQLAMLVPGITSNDIQNTPLGSTAGGKFQINVDGQQVTQNSAGDGFGEPQYSQDAIDQFQIITNRFDATLGRSSRAQIDAITKSGTNDFHGTLYGYFRNSEFNASDPVAHKVLPFSDQQFGGTVGGPILKNKLFFFFGYEGERQPNTLFDQPTGFPSSYAVTFNNELRTNSYILHTDYQINSKNRLAVRATGYTWALPYNGITGTSAPTRETNSTRTSYAVLGTDTWTVTPALVNELKIGFNHFGWSNDNYIQSQEYRLPTITFGAPYNYPQTISQQDYQYRDDLFWLKGGHSIKAGVDYLHNTYTGYFGQNVRGTVLGFSSAVSALNLASVFPNWSDPSTWNLAALGPYVSSFTQGFGTWNYAVPTNGLGFWLQDDWKVNKRLTLNLGLRYDNDLGIFNPDLTLKSGIKTPHYNDNLLFQPRVGFAYDVTGSRKTIIRGGAGLFYADIQVNQTIDDTIFNGQTTLSPSINATPSNPVNLANPLPCSGAQYLSGACPASLQTIQPLGPDVQTPYSFQFSIGVEHQLSNSWVMSVDYTHFRIYHDWIRTDANLFYNPATGYAQNPSLGRPNPSFAGILNFVTPAAAGSLNDALQIGATHRFSHAFSVQLAYTFARLKDSTTGPFYYPNNQMDLNSEWANSPDNQTHSMTVAASYNFKYGVSLSGAIHYGSGQNFQVTASQNPYGLAGVTDRLFTATSAFYGSPSQLLPSTVPGYKLLARDSLVGNPIERVDLRLSKTITVKERFRFIPMIEAFNLFNHSNFGSYQTVVNVASYGSPAANVDLPYAPRMLQFVGRFEF